MKQYAYTPSFLMFQAEIITSCTYMYHNVNSSPRLLLPRPHLKKLTTKLCFVIWGSLWTDIMFIWSMTSFMANVILQLVLLTWNSCISSASLSPVQSKHGLSELCTMTSRPPLSYTRTAVHVLCSQIALFLLRMMCRKARRSPLFNLLSQ